MNATPLFSSSLASSDKDALRPSVAATLCALLAMSLLLLTSGVRGWALPFCAFALLATHFTSWRWPLTSTTPAILRLVLFVALFLTTNSGRINIDWIFRDSTLRFLGQLAAVELVLQHWRAVRGARYPAVSLLLSCAVFLAACNVQYGFVPTIIAFVTPLFWCCLLWALRDWKPVDNFNPQNRAKVLDKSRKFLQSRFGLLNLGFLLVTLMGGAFLHRLGLKYREQLMSLGSNAVRQIPTSQGGISDRPRLSSSFNERLSTERILKVEGSLSDPHLRAAAFETYRLGAWSPSVSRRELAPWGVRQLGSAQSGARARVTRLVDLQTSPIFAPLNSTGIIPGPGNGIDEVIVQGNRESGLLICDENAPWTYQIIANEQNIQGVPTYQGPLCAPLTASDRLANLQLPDDLDPRVRQIALSAAGNATTPAEKAQNIAAYLMANHQYSLTFAIRYDAGDPLAQFLINQGAAHCEFFAAAMTIMARINGIPARYVIGYLAHESELGSGGAVTVVRQRDAHAWSEIWLDGIGWVTADATPGGGRPDVMPNVSAFQRVNEWARDMLENIRQRAVKVPKRTWFYIVMMPLGLWFLIRVQPFRLARGGAKSRDHDYESPDAKLAQLSPRFERWLARQGARVTPSLSWQRAFARHHLSATRPDVARWLHDYERARFGADWEIAEDLEARLREIEKQ